MMTMVGPYATSLYTVVVYQAEEGGYWGEVRELPGCVSQGETMDEFRRNIREALEAVLESESQAPRIQIYGEPTLAEKDLIDLGIRESREEKAGWVEVTESWTATG